VKTWLGRALEPPGSWMLVVLVEPLGSLMVLQEQQTCMRWKSSRQAALLGSWLRVVLLGSWLRVGLLGSWMLEVLPDSWMLEEQLGNSLVVPQDSWLERVLVGMEHQLGPEFDRPQFERLGGSFGWCLWQQQRRQGQQ
jgi:hypothetical protein